MSSSVTIYVEPTSRRLNSSHAKPVDADWDHAVPLLTVMIGDRRDEYRPDQLNDDLAGQLARERRVIVVIDNLLEWTQEERRDVMRFIVRLGQRVSVRTQVNDTEDRGLLSAAISLIESYNASGPNGSSPLRGQREAIEAAVLAHPHPRPDACRLIHIRLVQLGGDDTNLQAAQDEASELFAELNDGTVAADGDVTLAERLIESPLSEGAVAPDGYDVSMGGIFNQERKILLTPLLITGQDIDIRDGEVRYEIAWWWRDQWHPKAVAARRLANSAIRAMEDSGVIVPNNMSSKIGQYLADFLAANESVIPLQQSTTQLGWQGENGELGFLAGRTHITGRYSGGRPSESQPVVFSGRTDGEDQLADAIHSAGTFDNWQQAIEPLQNFPRVAFGLLAAFAAPLLKIVDAPGFAVGFTGRTSTGKTTVLRVCASVFGSPDERARNPIILTFDSTNLGLEQRINVQSDMPVLIDDTQTAGDGEKIGHLIYHSTSGQSHGRGSTNGARAIETFRNVVVFTGEKPVSSFTTAGGAHARTLEVTRPPFERTDEQTANLIADVNVRLRGNHGHAGPRLVQWLCDHREEWEQWQQRYDRLCGEYRRRAGDNSVASRQAEYFAILQLTAELAFEAGILLWGATSSVTELWTELMSESAQATQAAGADGALDALRNHYGRNRSKFIEGSRSQSPARPDGRVTVTGGERVVAFFPEVFNGILRRQGFDPEVILAQMNERGWLITTEERRHRRRIRVNGQNVSLIAIRRAVFNETGGEDELLHSDAQPAGNTVSEDIQVPEAVPPAFLAAGTTGTAIGTAQPATE